MILSVNVKRRAVGAVAAQMETERLEIVSLPGDRPPKHASESNGCREGSRSSVRPDPRPNYRTFALIGQGHHSKPGAL